MDGASEAGSGGEDTESADFGWFAGVEEAIIALWLDGMLSFPCHGRSPSLYFVPWD